MTSGHHWIADDSMIPNLPLIILKGQSFICNLKKEALTGLSIANPNFPKIAFSVEYFHKVSPEFSFQAIYELVRSRCVEILRICNSINLNLSFQIQVFGSWLWNLTMLGA
jgi:hypothetical protein